MDDVLLHEPPLESDQEFPDTATLRTALALATRAPSVHNSQPWRWRVGDRSLHLYVDSDRHLPHTDPDRRELLVSCGATLHHAVVALAALGWRAVVARLPNPGDPSHLASIQVVRREPDQTEIGLAAAIPLRRTDRRRYSLWPVPRADIATIGVRTGRLGVELRRIDATPNVLAIVARAVSLHLQDNAYLGELHQWSGRRAATAGVPARNSIRPAAAASATSRTFPGGLLDQHEITAEHGVLVALGTRDDDAESRLRAGEATSLALLTSTSFGLASCPVTEPLEIGETREELRRVVFDGIAHPQMILRIGWAPVCADPLPTTPRRSLDEVVGALDESPMGG